MAPAIEEAILVHRDGTFLSRYPLLATTGVDWAAQAQSLFDVMDAVGASFHAGPGDLRDLQFDTGTLHFTVGHVLILVTLVQGRPGAFLRRRLMNFLEDLEERYEVALSRGRVRPEDLPEIGVYLRHLVVKS